jgi:hypothetical protein
MLCLAGHVLRPVFVTPDTIEPDDDRLAAMKGGREGLRRLTGQDFGYDLARWHEFLAGNDEAWGYKHPYAWKTVNKAIEKAMDDPDRLRLVKVLEEKLR